MRVLVLGAGGPAGVSTCKALSGHEVVALDENPEHLVWCAPHATETHAAEITVETVNELRADVVIPQPDKLTLWLADHKEEIEADTFLPDRRTIALCQDKFEAGLAFRRANLRADRIHLVDSHPGFHRVELDAQYPFWLRARQGGGAKAALLARSWEEAAHWLGFWQGREPELDFIAEGYLPGRDLAWSSIWYEGELVCSFTRERLEYIYPHLSPEGLTGTPSIAQIVHDEAVTELAQAAVWAVDDMPHGIFSVDMREDEDGVPRPTEINAGRGFTTFGLWAMEAPTNLMQIIVRGATQDPPVIWDLLGPEGGMDCLPAGLKLYRHIDCGSFMYTPIPA